MPYTAVPATPDDLVELVGLMEAFYAEAGYALDRPWAQRSFAMLMGSPDRGAVWVLRQDRVAVGHIVLTLRFSMEFGGIDAFVDDLYIDPNHRRYGAGRVAMNALLDECRERGVLALHVEVAQDNVAANALYARCGLHPRSDERLTRTRVLGPAKP